MSESSMSSGLLAETPTQPKTSETKLAEAAQPSEASTSQSKRSKPRSQQDKLAAVNELLQGDKSPMQGDLDTDAGKGSDTGGGDANGPGGASDSPSPAHDVAGDVGELSVKELAERLGTSPKKLYESVQITTQEGETLTLGEVKDRIQSQEAATREIVKRETAISERESAMLQNMQLLQSVQDDLKGKLDPQTVQKLAQHTQQTEARERTLMMQAMPELADKAQLETFRNDVAEIMQPYGFKPHELVIRDHRIALAIKDLIQTKRQLAKLMEFEPKQDPPKSRKPQGKRKPPNRQAETIANARGSARPQDKAAAANAILKGAQNA